MATSQPEVCGDLCPCEPLSGHDALDSLWPPLGVRRLDLLLAMPRLRRLECDRLPLLMDHGDEADARAPGTGEVPPRPRAPPSLGELEHLCIREPLSLAALGALLRTTDLSALYNLDVRLDAGVGGNDSDRDALANAVDAALAGGGDAAPAVFRLRRLRVGASPDATGSVWLQHGELDAVLALHAASLERLELVDLEPEQIAEACDGLDFASLDELRLPLRLDAGHALHETLVAATPRRRLVLDLEAARSAAASSGDAGERLLVALASSEWLPDDVELHVPAELLLTLAPYAERARRICEGLGVRLTWGEGGP